MKTKEEWLDDMELRLKRALLDVADTDEAEGLRFLQEELASHLEDVGGETTRVEYLLSLKERFPQILPEEAAPVVEEMLPRQPQRSEEVSVEEALQIVRRDWDQLDPDAREAFLKAFGPEEAMPPVRTPDAPAVDPVDRAATFEQPSEELARYLKLPDDVEVPAERLQKALVGLLKTVSQVDSLGTQVYKQLGISRDLKAEDIRKLVGNYVGGDRVEADQLHQILDETRLKVGLIISTIANLPTTLSHTHMAKFQPSLIESSVSGGGGLLSGKEAKCWKKYLDLAEDLQPQKMEKVINDLMVQQLRKLKKRQ